MEYNRSLMTLRRLCLPLKNSTIFSDKFFIQSIASVNPYKSYYSTSENSKAEDTPVNDPIKNKNEKSVNSVDQYKKRKKEYQSEMSLLRKKFMEEVKERDHEKAVAKAEKMKQIAQERSKAIERRKSTKSSKQMENAAVEEARKKEKEKEKIIKLNSRLLREKKIQVKREEEQEAIKRSSCDWIEEKDLERRIIEAIAEPIML